MQAAKNRAFLKLGSRAPLSQGRHSPRRQISVGTGPFLISLGAWDKQAPSAGSSTFDVCPASSNDLGAAQTRIKCQTKKRSISLTLQRLGHGSQHCFDAHSNRPGSEHRVGNFAAEPQASGLALANSESAPLSFELQPNELGTGRVGEIGKQVNSGNRACVP
jgi:hypothetical protein